MGEKTIYIQHSLDDTRVSGTNNYPTSNNIVIGRSYIAGLRFDISSISSGAKIYTATLHVYYTGLYSGRYDYITDLILVDPSGDTSNFDDANTLINNRTKLTDHGITITADLISNNNARWISSVDMAVAVQELIDHASYDGYLIIEGSVTDIGGLSDWWEIRSYDYGSLYAYVTITGSWGEFTSDSIIKKTTSASFTVDAEIIPKSFTADAFIPTKVSDTFLADAEIIPKNFQVFSVIKDEIQAQFSSDSYISKPEFKVDAVIFRRTPPQQFYAHSEIIPTSFTADAVLTNPTFTADAYIYNPTGIDSTYLLEPQTADDDVTYNHNNGTQFQGSLLYMGTNADGSRRYSIGLRFEIPEGRLLPGKPERVSSAKLILYAGGNADITEIEQVVATVYGIDEPDTPDFSSENPLVENRSRTSASDIWGLPNWTYYFDREQDVTDQVKEIVSNPNFEGSHLGFYVRANFRTYTYYSTIRAYAKEASQKRPRLELNIWVYHENSFTANAVIANPAFQARAIIKNTPTQTFTADAIISQKGFTADAWTQIYYNQNTNASLGSIWGEYRERWGGNFGPWRDSNGNLYFLGFNTTPNPTELVMLKSADEGATWTMPDTTGWPEATGLVGTYRDGTTIHIAAIDETTPTLRYMTFHMSDGGTPDSLVLDETAYTPTNGDVWEGYYQTVSLVVRSTGEVVVVHNADWHVYTDAEGAEQWNYKVQYSIRDTGGSWSTTDIPVHETSYETEGFQTPYCSLREDDTVDIAYELYEDNGPRRSVIHRELSSGNVLSNPKTIATATEILEGDSYIRPMVIQGMVYYQKDTGGRVTFVWHQYEGINDNSQYEYAPVYWRHLDTDTGALGEMGTETLGARLYSYPSFIKHTNYVRVLPISRLVLIARDYPYSTPSPSGLPSGATVEDFILVKDGSAIGEFDGIYNLPSDTITVLKNINVDTGSSGNLAILSTSYPTTSVLMFAEAPLVPYTFYSGFQADSIIQNAVVGSVSAKAVIEDPQEGIPTGDSYVGNWTNESSQSTDLYLSIDEETESDSDYIQSELSPENSAVAFKISGLLTDPNHPHRHYVVYRLAKDPPDSNEVINFTVELREGYVDEGTQGTLIASWTHNDVSGTPQSYQNKLTSTQANLITDYTDLYMRFVTNSGGAV